NVPLPRSLESNSPELLGSPSANSDFDSDSDSDIDIDLDSNLDSDSDSDGDGDGDGDKEEKASIAIFIHEYQNRPLFRDGEDAKDDYSHRCSFGPHLEMGNSPTPSTSNHVHPARSRDSSRTSYFAQSPLPPSWTLPQLKTPSPPRILPSPEICPPRPPSTKWSGCGFEANACTTRRDKRMTIESILEVPEMAAEKCVKKRRIWEE
ncbi:MAG: hypothetical protein Q9218_004066, partial [Villophora microphyllina]